MRTGIAIFFICFLSTMFSCQEDNRIFDENVDISNGEWNRTESIKFNVDIPDSLTDYNLFYFIRNSVDYPFHNLYLRMSIKDSLGITCFDQNHELYLFHPQTGQPSGKSGSLINPSLGDLFDQKYPSAFGFNFPHKGKFDVEIRQFMRKEDKIPGVFAVGLRIDKQVAK